MKKILTILLTIIFFQTQIFSFPISVVAFVSFNSNSLKAIKEIPNNIKETFYTTAQASNVETLQQIGYNIGDKIYDYKENPLLLAKDATSLLISYDMYKAGFNNENMFYASGLIAGGLVLDIAGLPIKAGKGVVKTTKVTEKLANIGKELKVVENLTDNTTKYLGKDIVEYKTIKNIKAPTLIEGSQQERNICNSFAGGKFEVITYRENTKLYRIADRNGSFWSLDAPTKTEYEWRINYAIKQEFNNNASNLYIITIPKDSSITGLSGTVGSQGLGLYGGANQVYLDFKEIPQDWIKSIPMKWRY